jgi:hypothetical protein
MMSHYGASLLSVLSPLWRTCPQATAQAPEDVRGLCGVPTCVNSVGNPCEVPEECLCVRSLDEVSVGGLWGRSLSL